MIKKLKNFFYKNRWLVITFILLIFFWKIFNFSIKLSIFLFISILLIIIFPKKNRLLFTIFSILIGSLNIILVTFALIPTSNQQIDITKFFENQKNYLKIIKKDPDTILKKNFAILRIKRADRIFTYKLRETKNYTKIPVFQNDSILYEARTKNLNTFINLYLWDWTIIRIFPKTYLNLSKIMKNYENLLKSHTKISLKEWNIRFRVIKSIIDEKWFNIETPQWIIIIRWTSGIIWTKSNKTFVFSNDHLIEWKTKSWKKFFIKKFEIAVFNNKSVITITKNIKILKSLISKNINKLIKEFNLLDKKDIENYKNQFNKWLKRQLDYITKTNFLSSLQYYKLKILSFFSEKYKKDLQNYEIINLLLEKTNKIQNLDCLKNIIFVPLKDNIYQLKELYLKQKAKLNLEYMKNYIYYQINQMLEHWKNSPQLQNLLEKIKNF